MPSDGGRGGHVRIARQDAGREGAFGGLPQGIPHDGRRTVNQEHGRGYGGITHGHDGREAEHVDLPRAARVGIFGIELQSERRDHRRIALHLDLAFVFAFGGDFVVGIARLDERALCALYLIPLHVREAGVHASRCGILVGVGGVAAGHEHEGCQRVVGCELARVGTPRLAARHAAHDFDSPTGAKRGEADAHSFGITCQCHIFSKKLLYFLLPMFPVRHAAWPYT